MKLLMIFIYNFNVEDYCIYYSFHVMAM